MKSRYDANFEYLPQSNFVGFMDQANRRVLGVETFVRHTDMQPHYYAGEFCEQTGRKHGYGRFEQDDLLYIGQFCNNRFHGYGLLALPEKGGVPYAMFGMWTNGESVGEHEYVGADIATYIRTNIVLLESTILAAAAGMSLVDYDDTNSTQINDPLPGQLPAEEKHVADIHDAHFHAVLPVLADRRHHDADSSNDLAQHARDPRAAVLAYLIKSRYDSDVSNDTTQPAWDRAAALANWMMSRYEAVFLSLPESNFVGFVDQANRRVLGVETFFGHTDTRPHYYAGEYSGATGLKHGYGRFEDGDALYIGEMYNDYFHGRGMRILPDERGEPYAMVGMWNNGEPDGEHDYYVDANVVGYIRTDTVLLESTLLAAAAAMSLVDYDDTDSTRINDPLPGQQPAEAKHVANIHDAHFSAVLPVLADRHAARRCSARCEN